jgi:hypothetical protein
MASFQKDAILRFAQLAGDLKEEKDSPIKPGSFTCGSGFILWKISVALIKN